MPNTKTITTGFFLLLAGLMLTQVHAPAQAVSGDLVGTVTDTSGASIPNASVAAVNQGTNTRYTTTSNSVGEYRIANLPPGSYDLTASVSGFAPSTVKDVAIRVSFAATANIVLKVGEVSSAVDVTAAAIEIDTTTAQVQSSYSSKQASDLPNVVSGAGVLNLSLLQAGVGTSGGLGLGFGPTVGGQRPTNNNFMVEGSDNNGKYSPGPQLYIPNDSVQEFTLLQNQFQAEYGHSSGGQFNTLVKGGTNQFHGELYDYLQNRNLNARDQVFASLQKTPRYDNNRLGANFGGPIKKEKLFFFTSFEYNPIGQAATTPGAVDAPTASSYATLAGVPGINLTNLAELQKYATAPAVTPGAATITVNGVTVPTGLLPVVGPNFSNSYYGVGSLDYNISDKDQVRGRFLYNRNDKVVASAELPIFYTLSPTRYYLATISEYHTFVPTVVNELRLNYHRSNSANPATTQEFPGLDVFPSITFNDLNLQLGNSGPSFLTLNVYQAVDNVTWNRGKHTFKFGTEFRKYIEPDYALSRPNGGYQYTTVANYLLDLVPDYLAQRGLGGFRYYGDQIATYNYVQDTWRYRPNLTFDLGLRYEYTTVPYSQRLQSVNALADVPGLLTFASPKPQTKNFAPRIGVAYSPGKNGNTSIRAGFGIVNDVLFDSLGALSLPPELSSTITLTGQSGMNFLKNGGITPDYGGALNATFTVPQARALTASLITNAILPYSINYNLSVQHVFAKNYTFEVRFLGDKGVHLPVQNEYNKISDVTATNNIPTFLSAPSAATLASLPLTVGNLRSVSNIAPAYSAVGFTNSIIGVEPTGDSRYESLNLQMTRRFSNGLQFIGAYTWSHNLDNSSVELFGTYLSPRRPENYSNLRQEWGNSALDHRQRFTYTAIYDLPYFKNSSNWFMKNLVGNWEVAPVFTYESGAPYTPQSAIDSNLNGDTAGDRTIVNPSGVTATGTSVYGLTRSGTVVAFNAPTAAVANVVAWVATNPNARYIQAGYGAFATAGRDTENTRPIDNVDLTLLKRFSLFERYRFEFSMQAKNLLNHPQYIPGQLNDVSTTGTTATSDLAYVNVASKLYAQSPLVFSSNPRTIVIAAKFLF